MTQDQHGRSTAGDQPPSATAAEFDQEFATVAGSSGLRRVWQAASPDLPQEIEPYSFVSVGLLGHVADALGLSPGTTLVDLGCGRGGPGLWLAQARGARLIRGGLLGRCRPAGDRPGGVVRAGRAGPVRRWRPGRYRPGRWRGRRRGRH